MPFATAACPASYNEIFSLPYQSPAQTTGDAPGLELQCDQLPTSKGRWFYINPAVYSSGQTIWITTCTNVTNFDTVIQGFEATQTPCVSTGTGAPQCSGALQADGTDGLCETLGINPNTTRYYWVRSQVLFIFVLLLTFCFRSTSRATLALPGLSASPPLTPSQNLASLELVSGVEALREQSPAIQLREAARFILPAATFLQLRLVTGTATQAMDPISDSISALDPPRTLVSPFTDETMAQIATTAAATPAVLPSMLRLLVVRTFRSPLSLDRISTGSYRRPTSS